MLVTALANRTDPIFYAWDVETFTTVLETKCSGATLTVDGALTRSGVIAR